MAGPELSDLVMDGFGSGRGVGDSALLLLLATFPGTVECCQVLTTKRFWKNPSL